MENIKLLPLESEIGSKESGNRLKPDPLTVSKRVIDLALNAGRKWQSPRTGFVHLCSTDELASDTIPLFENFCFAMALFRQRSVESILEGKELVERLLAFQTPEGNFPIYLHDFPRCYDNWMCLRIAPILFQIRRHFSAVIGTEWKEKLDAAISRLLQCAGSRSRSALWEHRFLKLQGIGSDFSPATHDEWYHWIVSEQLQSSSFSVEIPYHPHLQAFIGGTEVQEKGEPRPVAIEWALAEKQGFPERLLRPHPAILQSALLFPIDNPKVLPSSPFAWIPEGGRLLWRGKSKLHSFSAPGGKWKEPEKIFFQLSGSVAIEKGDLIEAAVFCDISPETDLTIEGKKGTVFQLSDFIHICTPTLKIELRFDLIEGEGDFCGQISRANRPAQTACKGTLLYEAFDWRIAMRTLRRSPNCLIAASVKIC
jgi:hypothetical protein